MFPLLPPLQLQAGACCLEAQRCSRPYCALGLQAKVSRRFTLQWLGRGRRKGSTPEAARTPWPAKWSTARSPGAPEAPGPLWHPARLRLASLRHAAVNNFIE